MAWYQLGQILGSASYFAKEFLCHPGHVILYFFYKIFCRTKFQIPLQNFKVERSIPIMASSVYIMHKNIKLNILTLYSMSFLSALECKCLNFELLNTCTLLQQLG